MTDYHGRCKLVSSSSVKVVQLKKRLTNWNISDKSKTEDFTYQYTSATRYEYADILLFIKTAGNPGRDAVIELFMSMIFDNNNGTEATNSNNAQNNMIATASINSAGTEHVLLLPRVHTYKGRYTIDIRPVNLNIEAGSYVEVRPLSTGVV